MTHDVVDHLVGWRNLRNSFMRNHMYLLVRGANGPGCVTRKPYGQIIDGIRVPVRQLNQQGVAWLIQDEIKEAL